MAFPHEYKILFQPDINSNLQDSSTQVMYYNLTFPQMEGIADMVWDIFGIDESDNHFEIYREDDPDTGHGIEWIQSVSNTLNIHDIPSLDVFNQYNPNVMPWRQFLIHLIDTDQIPESYNRDQLVESKYTIIIRGLTDTVNLMAFDDIEYVQGLLSALGWIHLRWKSHLFYWHEYDTPLSVSMLILGK